MVCPGCKAENPEGKKFCGECGAALAAQPASVPVAGENGAWYCAKHVKTVTRLRCGRCETPICPKCTVYTPAGTRCRACAKNKIAVRPAGLLHEAVGTLSCSVRAGSARLVFGPVVGWCFPSSAASSVCFSEAATGDSCYEILSPPRISTSKIEKAGTVMVLARFCCVLYFATMYLLYHSLGHISRGIFQGKVCGKCTQRQIMSLVSVL